MANDKVIIAFDLYGTLLSTDSIAQELGKLCGEDKAKVIASQARRLQLEYSWRITCMGKYRPFSELTRWSFRQAAREQGVKLSALDEQRIMQAYNGLSTFQDADEALRLLRSSPGVEPYIFSNGEPGMLRGSLETSPGLSRGAGEVLPASRAVSVEEAGVFKPDPRAYAHLVREVGKEADLAHQVWVVSANPFDALGAVAAGLRSCWVDRSGGTGWIDGLGGALDDLRPTVTTHGVDGAVRDIIAMSVRESR